MFREGVEGCDFYENPKVEDVSAKVGDLGFICSGVIPRGAIRNCRGLAGDTDYIAPEAINYRPSSKYPLELAQKTDIWGLGLILGEMMFGKKYMDQIKLANKNYADSNWMKDFPAYEYFVDAYYSFVENAPDYNSGNDEFDRDLLLIFYNMIDLRSDLRSDVGKIIEEFPEL